MDYFEYKHTNQLIAAIENALPLLDNTVTAMENGDHPAKEGYITHHQRIASIASVLLDSLKDYKQFDSNDWDSIYFTDDATPED